MNPEIYTKLSFELFKFPVDFIGNGESFDLAFPTVNMNISHDDEKYTLEYTKRFNGEHIETITVHHLSTVLLMVQMQEKGLFK